MRVQDPTPDELRFFAALRARVPDIDDWYYADDDGTLWVIASLDFVDSSGWIRDTLRVDYDGVSLRGGWSPTSILGDDGVRFTEAGIDTGPDGLRRDNIAPLRAAQVAAEWFIAVRERQRQPEPKTAGGRWRWLRRRPR
ncbi:hypothetical protein [Nocardia iowensis]|uniref:Uncharacterized protein n=1 Tax=Nocardia iowensis TaxID=204891 RepID=A0ABX8RRL8_NOCIO|nr:hypothetical protein [Nocardia iowensis]QXN91534.1 hypothetical protein KV110_40610 [Nocardia iowensis]